MRAVVCEKPGLLTVAERPVPEPGPGEVLLRIRRVGVCGTDLHIFQGKQPFLVYPRVIGHELAAEVAGVGSDTRATLGQQVCVIPYLACGRCVACRRGRTNCCQTLSVLGVHQDGGLADYLTVPATHVLPAADLSLDQLAMVEFLAIGAHGVRRAAIAPGERALVVGSGPIGMAGMIFARAAGAEVTALDLRADRLAFCRDRLGAAHTVTAGADAEAQLGELTGGDLFDVVFDATGNAQSMQRSLGFVAHAGTYVLLGIVRDPITFPDPELHKRETTLLASRNATPEDFATVLAAIRAGRVPTAALNTHRSSLEEAPARFPEWLRPDAGVIKALIEL
jgi:2-desacetyl-2-hydroxyethyl bacteriochlorophyllide A dehydrogenase